MSGQSWDRWENKVLSSLEDLKEGQEKQAEQLSELREQVAELRVRAGFFGALSGALTSLIIALGFYFRK